MRHVMPFVLTLCLTSASANAQDPSIPEEPRVMGTGPIADDCRLLFADPIAQTACEVHISMDIEERIHERVEMLEVVQEQMFGILEEQQKRIEVLEQLHMNRMFHRLGINGEFGPIGNQDGPMLNGQGVPIVSEAPAEKYQECSGDFNLDLSGAKLGKPLSTWYRPLYGESVYKHMLEDGKRHYVSCVVEWDDDISLDQTRCCDLGLVKKK